MSGHASNGMHGLSQTATGCLSESLASSGGFIEEGEAPSWLISHAVCYRARASRI